MTGTVTTNPVYLMVTPMVKGHKGHRWLRNLALWCC